MRQRIRYLLARALRLSRRPLPADPAAGHMLIGCVLLCFGVVLGIIADTLWGHALAECLKAIGAAPVFDASLTMIRYLDAEVPEL